MIFEPYVIEIDLILMSIPFLTSQKAKYPPSFDLTYEQDIQDIIIDLATAKVHMLEYF